MKRRYILIICIAVFCVVLGTVAAKMIASYRAVPATAPVESEVQDVYDKIVISAAGDCTIGSDPRFPEYGSFHAQFAAQNGNFSYFFSGVAPVFSEDTLTFVNFEGTLTDATVAAEKAYTFRGPAAYANILKEGSVEVVSLSNNHSYDFHEKGFTDTKKALDEVGIGYAYKQKLALFAVENGKVRAVKEAETEITIGFCAFTFWYDDAENRKALQDAIIELKEKGADLVFVSCHWGIEGENMPNETQKALGRYAIDCGADAVLGHHPHVIQGIETYKGKEIVYSMGNFCFGGNHNPRDKDAFIYVLTYETKNGALTGEWESRIIPCSISSSEDKNDYRPRILSGEAATRVYDRVKAYSKF